MSRTFRVGYPGISSSALMDALIELKDYIALTIIIYPCRGSTTLLFTSAFDGRWEALRRVA